MKFVKRIRRLFKTPPLVDVDKVVEDTLLEDEQRASLNPHLKELHRSVKIINRESRKTLETIDVAMRIATIRFKPNVKKAK